MATTKIAIAPMKAAQIPKGGADFQIVEREIPAPGVGEVRIKVQETRCTSNLHQISQALQLYKDNWDRYPIVIDSFVAPVGNSAVLVRPLGRHEKECLVLDNRAADRAGELSKLVRNIDRQDRVQACRNHACGHRTRTKAVGAEALCLKAAAGTIEPDQLAVQTVGARFCDDI